MAIKHFRHSNKAQNKLKNKWIEEIEKQDYMYNLSKATNADCDLPKVKESFVPRPHQKVGIEFGNLCNGKFLIVDQQRTGKSFTALLYALSQDYNKILIVSPSKVVSVWESMIDMITDGRSKLHKVKVLGSGDELESGFNIVSYDTLHRIDDLSCDIAITDEAHFFLEDSARRSKAVHRIVADKRIALSATPIMNDISDLIAVLEWVNPQLALEMSEMLNGISYLSKYEQANIMSTELRRRCMLLRETSQVGKSIEPYINFVKIDTKIDDPKNLQKVGKAKVDFMVQYLNSFKHKILVAFYYKETGKALKARLGDNALMINGDSGRKEVDRSLEKFKNGDVQFLLGSTVLAEGIDVSHCSHLVMMEESSYSMRTDQLRERCNNINKTEEVSIDILIAPGTQDDRLYELLNDKFELQEGMRDS